MLVLTEHLGEMTCVEIRFGESKFNYTIPNLAVATTTLSSILSFFLSEALYKNTLDKNNIYT